jgi:hypothetical protein
MNFGNDGFGGAGAGAGTGVGAGVGAGAGAGDFGDFGAGGFGAGPNAMPVPSLNEFKAQDIVGGSKSFLDSNSYVAKAAFLILVVIVFVYLLRLCITVIGYLFSPSSSPYLVNGVIDAKVGNMIIPQDPSESNAVSIIRSVNDDVGIGFTWSAWIYIKQNDSTSEPTGMFHHVFNKGSATADSTTGLMTPNNGPGLYLNDNYSGLRVVMSTFDDPNTSTDVDNIPVNKWVNVLIRVENTVLDIFINGDLAQRLPLGSVPFQNYGDVNVAINGGFNGNLSSLRYYNTSLGTRAIQNIVSSGPNLKVIGASGGAPGTMDYLSMRWFFSQWNGT